MLANLIIEEEQPMAQGTEQSTGFGMDNMPPNVLQKIFDFIETRSELLNLRMVSRKWATNVSEVIGNRTNAQFCKWDLVVGNPEQHSFPVPKLIVGRSIRSVVKVIFPFKLISSYLNPFPTQSVSLVSKKPGIDIDEYELKPFETKIGLYPMLWNFGANLKTLEIIGRPFIFPSPQTLFLFLANLKSLKLKRCDSDPSERLGFNRSAAVGNTFPTLKNLTLILCTEDLTIWLLQTFASTLETLELDSVTVQPFSRERYPNPDDFKKLRNLRVIRLQESFMSTAESWIELSNLERLAIDQHYDPCHHLPGFVSMFQETLLELRVDKKLVDVFSCNERNGNADATQRPTFSKVNKLCIISAMYYTELYNQTEMIMGSFPNLRILQLVNTRQIDNVESYYEGYTSTIWQSCPNVNCIEVLYNTSVPEYQLFLSHTFTRKSI